MNIATGSFGPQERWTVRLDPAASESVVLQLLPKRLVGRTTMSARSRPEEEGPYDNAATAGQLLLPGLATPMSGLSPRKGCG